MAFDEAKFRKLAAENGYSEEEIQAHIGALTNKATGQAFGAASDEATAKAKQEAADAGIPMPGATAQDGRSSLEKVFDFATSPMGTAALGLLAIGAGTAVKKGIESRKVGQQPMPEPIEPVLITPKEITEASNPVDKLKQAKERLAQGQAAGIGPKQPVAPTYNVPTANAPQIPAQTSTAAPMPVQPPAAVAPIEPSVAQAVEVGASPSKAVQLDVAKQLDAASGIAPRVRRTKEQIEQAAAQALANAPEGMIPSAPRKTNKMPGDVIGQGGWHWYEGQMGPEAQRAWLQEFGRTNQPYSRVVEAVKEGRLPIPAPVDGKKGGTFPRQEYVPEYIKGAVSPGMLLNLAGNAIGALGLKQAYDYGKKTGDWSELGLGTIGQVLGNIAPKVSTAFSLMAPSDTNKGEKEELAKRRKMKSTID